MTNKLWAVFAAVGLAGTAAFAQGMGPGMVGHVDGQAAIDGKPVMPGSEGRMAVTAGQMIATGNGHAEVTLTPGVVVRLDRSTVVKVIAEQADQTEVLLQSGRATVVVGNLPGSPDIEVDAANGVKTALIEHGVYGFDAKAGELKVFDGKAAVSQSETAKWIDVKAGHEIALNGSATKASDFDERADNSGFGEGPRAAYGDWPGYAYAPGYALGDGYAYGYDGGFYGPYAYNFYPGFYAGFYPGFYGGFGYGGFGYGGFRGGYGGFGGGFRGGFGGGRR